MNRPAREVTVVAPSSRSLGGQAIYEASLLDALDTAVSGSRIQVRFLGRRRSAAGRLLPRTWSLPTQARVAVGAFAYPTRLVHRLDLALPPGRIDVLTVHDLAPLRFPDEAEVPDHLWGELARARVLVTASAFIAEEIQARVPQAVVEVIPHGVPLDVDEYLVSPTTKPDVDGPYCLVVGGATQRKNLSLLARAWPYVRNRLPGLKLLSVGPMERERREALSAEGVIFRPALDRREVLSLMDGAETLLIPSIYEGFGLPALEAMRLGTPLVATRCAAFPEICGDGALLADPEPFAFADAVVTAVNTGRSAPNVTRGRERAASFTWERSARAHLDLYEQLMD